MTIYCHRPPLNLIPKLYIPNSKLQTLNRKLCSGNEKGDQNVSEMGDDGGAETSDRVGEDSL